MTVGQTFSPAAARWLSLPVHRRISASGFAPWYVVPDNAWARGIIGTAHVNLAGFLDPAAIADNAAYLFVEGYPALSNDMATVADDLVDNEPMPALGAGLRHMRWRRCGTPARATAFSSRPRRTRHETVV